MTQVNLSLKEIYQKLCPKCQKTLRDILKDKLADQLVKQALEEDKKANE
ncbi:hypothetical protein ES703_123575 [subsurface metagenome]